MDPNYVFLFEALKQDITDLRKDLRSVNISLKDTNEKLDDVRLFKAKLIGGAIVVSIVTSGLFQLALAKIK